MIRRQSYKKEKRAKKRKVNKFKKSALLHCPCCDEDRELWETKTLVHLEEMLRERSPLDYYKQKFEGWAIEAAKKQKLEWACDICLSSGKALTATPWLQSPTAVYPIFAYYNDRSFTCVACGEMFLFSVKEQRFWYETLQFIRWSEPRECVPCRHKKRVKKGTAHDLQHALEILDPENTTQLQQVAELYIEIENYPKALEFFRRAKNRTNNEDELKVLRDHIAKIKNQEKN